MRITRSAWLAFLVLIFCHVCVQAQEKEAGKPQYVILPAEIMDRELTTIDSRHLKLSNYSDKIIVMNMFASWCRPCVENLIDLVLLRKEYQTHPIEVIGLVSEKDEADIEAIHKLTSQLKIEFQVVWDTRDFGESLVKTVAGQRVLPQTFVIDKRGRTRKHFQGYNSQFTPRLLREALDRVGQEQEANNSMPLS
jgi:peroxiredoxin